MVGSISFSFAPHDGFLICHLSLTIPRSARVCMCVHVYMKPRKRTAGVDLEHQKWVDGVQFREAVATGTKEEAAGQFRSPLVQPLLDTALGAVH